MDELSKLDDLEFDTEKDCPYADRVMQEKRQRLRSTYFKILEYYKNTEKIDQWKEHQEEFNQYEKERERKKSLFAAVMKAKNWSVDHIPLPDAPMPDAGASYFGMGGNMTPQAPLGLPQRSNYKSVAPVPSKKPPGPPPGPPPAKKNYKRPKSTNVQSKLLEIAGLPALDSTPSEQPEEKKVAPPPPPGIPPTENRAKNNPYQQTFTPRQASTMVPQQAPLVQSHMVPPHLSTYQQYQYQNVQPTGTITAAPTVYKGSSSSGATPVAQSGPSISSEPQLKKPKGLATSFIPTALRGSGGQSSSSSSMTSRPAPTNRGFVPSSLRPSASSIGPSRPSNQKSDTDKAYEKFMKEMSGMM